MRPNTITNSDEHRAALQEIERLWNATPGSAAEVRLEELVHAVEAYESAQFGDNVGGKSG